jgi:hypothetical protein
VQYISSYSSARIFYFISDNAAYRFRSEIRLQRCSFPAKKKHSQVPLGGML